MPLPLPPRWRPLARRRQLANTCSPVSFNDIKRLARSMPADGLEAQDVVPPRCSCWVAHMAIFSSRRLVFGKAQTLARHSQHFSQAPATIVFTLTPDPVGAGFVESLARPGGNATGFTLFEYGIGGKWLELLKEITPGVMRAAVVRDPALPQGTGFSAQSNRRPRLSEWN